MLALSRLLTLVRIGLLVLLVLASGNLFVYFLAGFILLGFVHYLLWGRTLSREVSAEPGDGEAADAPGAADGLWGNHGAGAFDADPHG
jgi:hypothetical protein